MKSLPPQATAATSLLSIPCRAFMWLWIILFTLPAFCEADEKAEEQSEAPRAVCNRTAWNFGEKNRDNTVRNSFTISNDGNATLKIEAIRLSCKSCFSAQMTRRKVPPGKTAELKIIFDLKKSKGRQHKTVLLKTNDLKSPYLTFRISGTVKDTDDDSAVQAGQRNQAQPETEALDSSLSAFTSDYSNARLLVFTDPGCDQCQRLQQQLREQKAEYPDMTVAVVNVNTSAQNRLLQTAVTTRLNVAKEHRLTIPMVASSEDILYGEISNKALTKLMENASHSPFWQNWNERKQFAGAKDQINNAVKDFSISILILAGMADGINPCAFAVIVFLITCLTLSSGRSRHYTLACGVLFCLGVFIFYYLFGLGFLKVAGMIQQWQEAERFLMYSGATLSFIFGGLAFIDVRRIKQKGSDSMKFGMPKSFRAVSHRLMRTVRNPCFLLPAAVGLGFLVSAVEAVCTGQIYLPALLLINQQGGNLRSALLLLVYNVSFILPLLAVVFAVGFGLNSKHLISWGTRYAVVTRLFAGCIVIGLGVLLLVMAV